MIRPEVFERLAKRYYCTLAISSSDFERVKPLIQGGCWFRDLTKSEVSDQLICTPVLYGDHTIMFDLAEATVAVEEMKKVCAQRTLKVNFSIQELSPGVTFISAVILWNTPESIIYIGKRWED